MAGIYKLEIEESREELKALLREQKTTAGKERVQLLYLLKTGQARTVQAAAEMLGRHRVSVQEWLRKYREGGMKQLERNQGANGTAALDSELGTTGTEQAIAAARRVCELSRNL